MVGRVVGGLVNVLYLFAHLACLWGGSGAALYAPDNPWPRLQWIRRFHPIHTIGIAWVLVNALVIARFFCETAFLLFFIVLLGDGGPSHGSAGGFGTAGDPEPWITLFHGGQTVTNVAFIVGPTWLLWFCFTRMRASSRPLAGAPTIAPYSVPVQLGFGFATLFLGLFLTLVTIGCFLEQQEYFVWIGG